MPNKKIKCFDDFNDSNFLLDDLIIRFRISDEMQKELDFNKTLDGLGFVSEDFDDWREFEDHFCDAGLYLIISSNNNEIHLAVIDPHEFADLMCELCYSRQAKVTFDSTRNLSDGSDITKSNMALGSIIMAPMMELFEK